jgi:hypothetical protein
MYLDIFTLIALALAAYLGTITSSSAVFLSIKSQISRDLPLGYSVLAAIAFALLIIVWLISCLRISGNRSRFLILGTATALISAHCARISSELNLGFQSGALWAVTILLSLISAVVTRVKTGESFDADGSLSVNTAPPDYRLTRINWVVFCLIAIFSAVLFSYKLFDIPGDMNGFGTLAISAANRLLHGELAIRELVLFREMTQEECANSILYVFWHGFFQVFSGGISFTAARVACAAASWLSVLMMFRVGRHLGGVRYGLISMATYAAIPVTLFNARSEGIFGFSALLILVIADLAFLFLRRPSVTRAIVFGFAAPLAGYGIANIKLYLLAIILTLICAIARRKQLGLYAKRGALSIVIALLILLPQLFNLEQVRMRVRGRGEHIFGGVLNHLAQIDPAKPTPLKKATKILKENFEYLSNGLFGPWTGGMPAIPSGLAVALVIGLCMIVRSPLSPARIFLALMFIGGYFAPLISIPIGWTRILMLNIAQALVISSVWSDLFYSLGSWRFRRLGYWICCAGLIFSFNASVPAVQYFFNQTPTTSAARHFILQQPINTIVFFTDLHEASGNTLRWNPPHIGRDSDAERQVIVIREESVESIASLIERLDIRATILSNNAPPSNLVSIPEWHTERISLSLWAMQHTASNEKRVPTVKVLEPTRLDSNSAVIVNQVSYTAPRLFMTRMTPKSPINLDFQIDTDLDPVAIIARGRNSYSAPVSLEIDNNAVAVEPVQHIKPSSQSGNSSWFYTPKLTSGTHTVSLQLQEDAPPNTGFIEDIVIIGVPAGSPSSASASGSSVSGSSGSGSSGTYYN